MITALQYQEMSARLERNQGRVPPEDAEQRESDLHEKIMAYCREKRWYFVHSRMDRKSTQNVGVPDLIVALPNGAVWWIELKARNGKLSPEQTIARVVLLALGHKHEVVHSLAQFMELVK